MKPSKAKSGWFSMAVSGAVFLLILAALFIGTRNLAGGTGAEGQRATQQAIERAAVLCYATEGFYPPSLEYIQQNYGVQIDTARYTVRYETFASNVMPVIQVNSW